MICPISMLSILSSCLYGRSSVRNSYGRSSIRSCILVARFVHSYSSRVSESVTLLQLHLFALLHHEASWHAFNYVSLHSLANEEPEPVTKKPEAKVDTEFVSDAVDPAADQGKHQLYPIPLFSER